MTVEERLWRIEKAIRHLYELEIRYKHVSWERTPMPELKEILENPVELERK